MGRNKREDQCGKCEKRVGVGEGYSYRTGKEWRTIHAGCTRRRTFRGSDAAFGEIQRQFKMKALASEGRCYICRKALYWHTATVDHIIPLARGGTHAPENFKLACRGCNTKKSDRLTLKSAEETNK